MNNFPNLETDRLRLGNIPYTDIPKIIEYAGNIKIAETTLNIPHPYHVEDAIFWINSANQGYKDKTQYSFAIRLKSNDEFIGSIGLKVNSRFESAEMGYWMAVPFWNKGYASEAAGAILKYGFEELKLNKIYATYLSENPASGKVMINNRMIKEAELKDHTKKGEKFSTLLQYRLTKNEFNNH